MTTPVPVAPDQLPAPARAYLAAHAARAADVAIRCFAPDARVVDEERTYHGTREVLGFLRNAGAEFSYTTELVGAQRVDATHWTVLQRLEGDFPGRVADLRYRFELAGDLISELVIAP